MSPAVAARCAGSGDAPGSAGPRGRREGRRGSGPSLWEILLLMLLLSGGYAGLVVVLAAGMGFTLAYVLLSVAALNGRAPKGRRARVRISSLSALTAGTAGALLLVIMASAL